MSEPAETPPPKCDPEALSLRARPAPAIRFKREVVIGAVALAALGIFAVAWIALKPSDAPIGPAEGDAAINLSAPTDTLAQLPASYEDVPELGPPLPGDLGRPILRRRQLSEEAVEDRADAMIDQQAVDERAQELADKQAALASAILAQTSSPAPQPMTQMEKGRAPSGQVSLAPERSADANTTDRGTAGRSHTANLNPVEPPASPYMLNAGSVIAASLITGLRSDLPGLVVAQVTERVFDSATGRVLLIPQGARLIGSYDSTLAFGQRRALIVWQRLVLPDGSSLTLDEVPAADPSGYAGLADQVDFHTWSLVKGAAISTLLSIGSNLTFSDESDLVEAIREATQQNTTRAGDQLVSRSLSIQPTITVRPGAPVRLIVHRDLILQPWQE